MVYPNAEPEHHGCDCRERHGRVADQRTSAECWQSVRHHPHCRQHDGVDPRMAEHPEQMLPEQGLPARRHVEEMRPEIAVHPKEEKGEARRRNGEDIGGRRGQRSPNQDRHAVDGHAGRAHPQKGDDEIDCADRCRNTKQDHAQRVEIDVRSAIVGARRIRHIIEPAVIGSETQCESGIEKNPGAEIEPIGERVEAGQRHVARAEQKRPEIIAEARKDRPGVKENHRHAVHGEKLIILLGTEQMLVRLCQLQAEDQRLDAASGEKAESGDDVADADLLMIDARKPAQESWAGFPKPAQFAREFTVTVVECNAGRADIGRGRCGHARSVQGCEEGMNVAEFRGRQFRLRHGIAGLGALRIGDPIEQDWALSFGKRARADGACAA